MKIIAFGHQKQVGKDESAKFLYRHARMNSKKIIKKESFADELYRICFELYHFFGFRTKEYYDQNPSEKEKVLPVIGKTPRVILIEVGLKMREVYEDTWIDYVLSQAKNVDLLIIADLRYPNEFEKVRSYGGVCVKVIDDKTNVDRSDKADQALVNETRWDCIIENTGTLAQLAEKVEELYEQYCI